MIYIDSEGTKREEGMVIPPMGGWIQLRMYHAGVYEAQARYSASHRLKIEGQCLYTVNGAHRNIAIRD